MILMAKWELFVLVLLLLFNKCAFQSTQRNATSSGAVQLTSVKENIWLSLGITASSSLPQPTSSSYGSTSTKNSSKSSEEKFQVLIVYITVSVAASSIAVVLLLAICFCRSGKRKKAKRSRNNSEQIMLSNDTMQQSIEVIPRPESEASSHIPTSESGDDQNDNIQQRTELIPRPESKPSSHTPTSESDEIEIPPTIPRKKIQREQLRIGIKLGEGAFGFVSKCILTKDNRTEIHAVKTVKENAPPSDLQDLINEFKIMLRLKPHPNVVKLIGAALDDTLFNRQCQNLVQCSSPQRVLLYTKQEEHPLVVVEFVPFGDLLGYLRKSRGIQDTCYTQTDHFPITSLTSKDLLKFAIDSAKGMEYLAEKKIVHRDLAARNVLVGEGRTCKITDFGMARDVRKNEIYTKTTRGLVPVKWTAIESIIYGKYTTRSDVWSFGVLLFEILTVGGCPYPRMDGYQVRQKISEGYRMPKPTHVDNELYAVMCECWNSNPRKRPTFMDLVCILKRLQPRHKEYVNLSQYNPCHYENVDTDTLHL